MIYGYGRVSTKEQDLAAQIEALTAAGAEKVFRETASGAKTQRRELARAKKRAKAVGVHFGPRFALTPHQQREVLARRESGELVADIAASYGVSRRTILRTKQVMPVFAASRAGHRGYRGQV
jgi:DNA invertase Pin-like site-specific DNA recombinase